MPTKTTNRSYLAKDFNSLRSDILIYARTYFSEQISDFSEASMGGLLLDMAAMVGDTMSFYLDYQFNELNPSTAIETQNIVTHATNAGVPIVGAAPAVVDITFTLTVPSKLKSNGSYGPNEDLLPIIKALDTKVRSTTGIYFTLDEDINLADKNDDGVLLAEYRLLTKDSSGAPSSYLLSRTARCLSGFTVAESFELNSNPVPFRKIVLKNQDVSQITSLMDANNNEYYEVESLTQDVIYKRIKNLDPNKDTVESSFEIKPAPYRYVAKMNFTTRLTTLQFGSGDDTALDDDILPDPSQLALPLYGKKVFKRFSIDPNALLKTKTLGISPKNTTLKVIYRYGGGLSNNVVANSIKNIDKLVIEFPVATESNQATAMVNSLVCNNIKAAAGGAPPLTIADLKTQISSARNQQSRIVTQQDLLSRIYTLPSNFGRVVRASLAKDERNPLATQLFVLSLDRNAKLAVAPDALKMNMSKYLNEFRLISDAIDILDGTVINYGINFTLITVPSSNKSLVVASVISNLKKISQFKYFQMDQPLVESDIISAIIRTPGVLSLIDLQINNLSGVLNGRVYSDFSIDLVKNKFKGLYLAPPGTIFELKYPDFDIVGNAE